MNIQNLYIIFFNEPSAQAAFSFYQKTKKKFQEKKIKVAVVFQEKKHQLFFKQWSNLSKQPFPPTSLYNENFSLHNFLSQNWSNQNAFLFFASTGIVIRKISPLLISKYIDPAVLAADFSLRYFIPLLSGHVGGAVQLAKTITKWIDNSHCVLTGASDQLDFSALDILSKDWQVSMNNTHLYPALASAIVQKEKILVYAPLPLQNFLQEKKSLHQIQMQFKNMDDVKNNDEETASHVFAFSWHNSWQPNCFFLKVEKIFLGMGMNRGISLQNIEQAFFEFLQKFNLQKKQIQKISSIDIKQDETALLEFCQKHSFTLEFFDKEEINHLQNDFSESAAKKFLQVKGVAEPCAVLSSINKTILISKKIYQGVTIAAAF